MECEVTCRSCLVMTTYDATRFRWVFCQLEKLRQCLPQSVRRTLNELPESLDDTYERVMMEIKRSNQAHAYRMLQCLTVAIRPLTVAELAELLAFDFDVAKGGIPKLNSDWRWEDHEQAVLSTCSSLVTVVVPKYGSPVVQFSHFSVKEFLLSDRLATSTKDISQYHISLEDAHTLLAQASLSVLLRDPDVDDHADSAPLDRYAAEHWVTHAQVENVASRVRDGMEYLFDPDKPYFEEWVRLHDIERSLDRFSSNEPDLKPGARLLYYAALCGFHELVAHLFHRYPQSASANVGRFGTALHAASRTGHLQVVQVLLRHGLPVNVQDSTNYTPLILASYYGHRDVAQCLLEHGADVDWLDGDGDTPLNSAAYRGHADVVRVLLEHNANVNPRDSNTPNPLRSVASASREPGRDHPQVALLLLEYGANPNSRNTERQTPLHLSSGRPDRLDVIRILLEHGADADAEDKDGKTPLQVALAGGHDDVAQLLSRYSRRESRGSVTSV
jgi:ankyrin repeat protein